MLYMFCSRGLDKSLTIKRNKFLALEIKHVSILLRAESIADIKTFLYSDSNKNAIKIRQLGQYE